MKKPVEIRTATGTVFILLLDLVLILDLITNNTFMTDYTLEIGFLCSISGVIIGIILNKGYYDDNNEKVENYDVQFSISLVIALIFFFILL